MKPKESNNTEIENIGIIQIRRLGRRGDRVDVETELDEDKGLVACHGAMSRSRGNSGERKGIGNGTDRQG